MHDNQNHEINKFTSKASQWWDKNGSFKLLHDINPLRVEFILNNISSKNKSILDVGCGGGILCETLVSSGFDVTGLDAGFENIEVAKKHALESGLNIDYIHDSLENIANEKKFDVVIALEVIEHSDNYIDFLTKLCDLLNPNGILFLSTINRTTKSYLQAIIGAEYILRWIPKKTHDWKKFLKPSEIEFILRKNNVLINDIKGFKYNFCKKKWHLSQNLDVNYILCANMKKEN